MKSGWGVLVCVACLAQQAESFGGFQALHESDLAGPAPLRIRSLNTEITPDRVNSDAAPGITGALEVQLVRVVSGQEIPISGVEFKTTQGTWMTDVNGRAAIRSGCSAGGTFELNAKLENRYFSIQNPSQGKLYELKMRAPCQGRVQWGWNAATDGGQVLGIWQVAETARTKLQASVGLGFWKRPVNFVFPSHGDYYAWGKVNVTRGDHWDVVGHEMGHAIYDLAGVGDSEGGEHKIDECYRPTLAFSEGWASFFSAWIGVSLSDPDAKFEYLVPRRAPIRFESIPEDVCYGQSNEWRVTGFLWDLVDLSRDPEAIESPFSVFWQALVGRSAASAQEASEILIRSGAVQESEIKESWEQNFKTPWSP
ncbi:MAG: hypothetical protein ACK5QT_08600 [Oligoflexia bacterium]|jgi:hypothetical protein